MLHHEDCLVARRPPGRTARGSPLVSSVQPTRVLDTVPYGRYYDRLMSATNESRAFSLASRTAHVASETALCMLCGADFRPWFRRQERHFERCPRCGLIVVPEGLAVDVNGVSIYESQQSVFESDGNEGDYLDHEANLANCRSKLAWVADGLPPGASWMPGQTTATFSRSPRNATTPRASTYLRRPCATASSISACATAGFDL